MLLSPDDAAHFLEAYKDLLHKVADLELKHREDYAHARNALFGGKYRNDPPTDDEDLLAALETAAYGDFFIGRHLVKCTEMVGPKEKVYWVKGITTELSEITPPWVWVKTAAMLFKGHWICDGLIESQNIFIGSNMRRDLSEKIRNSKPPKEKKSKKAASGCKEDKSREERITMEIVVDCYDERERAMGWYHYLEECLHFPFLARCIKTRPISPLEKDDEIKVVGMPKAAECEHEMFVEMKWKKRTLAVPLSQLEVVDGDAETKGAVADWHYWVNRGYQF